MMRNLLSILLFFLSTFTSVGFAQFEHFYENWRWAHFTTKTGLPSNYIEEIIETEDSTVWVSTYKGIAWYDGYRWNPVIIGNNNPEQPARKIEPFYDDKIFVIIAGSLFIGDKNGFIKTSFAPFPENGVVRSVCAIDSTAFLSIFEYGDSTCLYKQEKGVTTRIIAASPGNIIKSESSIWVLVSGDREKPEILRYTKNGLIKLQSDLDDMVAIRHIVENKKGNGLFAVDAPKNTIGVWEYDLNLKPAYSVSERNQPIRALDISETNEVLVAYESGEVHIRQNNIWHNILPLPKQMLNIVTIKYRDNNDVWLGTDNGVYLFKRHGNLWKSNHATFSDLNNVVMEIFNDRNGDIWVGTMNGLEIISSDGKIKSIDNIEGKPIGLVTGINQDKYNNIWISTGSGFKGTYEWNGKKWTYHNIHSSNINFHKIRKDNEGNLWFLGLGIQPKDPAGYIYSERKWTRIDSAYVLPSNRLYSFLESKSGIKWFGSSNGLTRIKNGKTSHWGREQLGKTHKIYTATIDTSENIWFSTFSSQLGTITESDSVKWIWNNDELYTYKQKVWDLSFDSTGVLWVATTKGLFRYYNSTWSNYSMETGMNFRELRVVLPTADKIFVGGHGIGLHSTERKYIVPSIKIFISKPIIESNDLYCSWEPISFWGAVPSEQIETRYKLDTQSWSSWSTLPNVILRDLESGDHTLYVQAKDSYGNIHSDNSHASFTVEPPVFLHPVFIISIMGMLFVVGFTITRYQISQRRNKLIIQNQRTRIANDLHDEVGSNLASIALISQRVGRKKDLPDETREDLLTITETSLQTSEYLKDIVWYTNPRYDTFMNLETRLREISSKMLKDVSVHLEMTTDGQEDKRYIDYRRNIILMYKEILHNIVKHSRATFVSIRCEHKADSFFLSVKDNGVGFRNDIAYNGNGLLSLQRRCEESGAELKIISQKGEGTEINIVFKTNLKTL